MGINLGWKEIHVGVTKCIVLNCRRRTVKKKHNKSSNCDYFPAIKRVVFCLSTLQLYSSLKT